MTLTLYRDFEFETFRYPQFEKVINGNFQLLLASGLRRTAAPQVFFANLLILNEKRYLALSRELKEHFISISKEKHYCNYNLSLVDLPPFYNKAGEFYSLLFQNFSRAYFEQLCQEINNTRFESLKLTLLYEFYQEAELLLNRYRLHNLPTRNEEFIQNIVLLSLFNLYKEVLIQFPDLHPNNKLTINELLHLVTVDYSCKKKEEGALEFYLAQYLNRVVGVVEKTEVGESSPIYLSNEVVSEKAIKTPGDVGLITMEEAKTLLTLKETAISALVRKGEISKTKIGKFNMYHKDSIIKYLGRK